MVMEDVVKIDPGNLSVSMAMGDVVEIDPGNLSVLWEIESSGTDYMSGSVVVKGRLKNHISFWREVIKAPATIISTIEGGYVLPLKSEPTPYVRGNHQSACKIPCSFRRAYLSSALQVVRSKYRPGLSFAAHCPLSRIVLERRG